MGSSRGRASKDAFTGSKFYRRLRSVGPGLSCDQQISGGISELHGELAKHPNNSPALMTLAMVYEKIKDFPKARDAYEKLLSIEPGFVPALNNLAYLYAERLNDVDKAYDLARKARDLQGHDPGVGDTFGWVLY